MATDNFSKFGKSFKEFKKHPIPPLIELIVTEDEYIRIMGDIVNGYMEEFRDKNTTIPVPDNLKDHRGYLIFANIVEIYEWHRDYFSKALKQHVNSPKEFGKVFIQNEHHFHMYAKYCNNKELSDYLVNTNLDYFDQVKKKLGHKLLINDLLITPVQRPGRYRLLLAQIIKHVERNKLLDDLSSLHEALRIVKEVCKDIDEFTALQGIKNFDGLVSAQGKLLIHGRLTCNYDGRKRKLYVFLFKRIIIFTNIHEAKNKYANPTYDFRLQIPLNKLHLKELSGNRFSLSSTDPNCSDLNIVCYPNTTVLHDQWVQAINQQLLLQRHLIHNLVNPPSTDGEDQREILL